MLPGFSLAPSSRLAFPFVLAMVSWVTYNGVGIKKHGFFGYLRHTCIIPAAPWWLRYTLLMVIEFVSNIIVRPITLTVRLWANFLAGHFLLAIFFLGTLFFLEAGPKTWILARVSYRLRRSCSSGSRSSSPHCKRSSSRSSAPPTSGRRWRKSTSQGGTGCCISSRRPLMSVPV